MRTRRLARFGWIVVTMLAIGVPIGARADEPQVAALYQQSYALEAARDFGGAVARVKDVQSKAGKSYFAVVRVGWLSYLGGDFAASEAAYREAIGLAPKSVEAKLGLTLPLLASKKWRDLEKACRDVLSADAQNMVARARLASALYSLGNYPDSATLYRKLVDEYPADLDHKTGLGWALVRMGRRQDGKQLFAQVLAVSPDNPNAKQGMAFQ
jgi:tetratricopeptide (TPR) repeat protein